MLKDIDIAEEANNTDQLFFSLKDQELCSAESECLMLKDIDIAETANNTGQLFFNSKTKDCVPLNPNVGSEKTLFMPDVFAVSLPVTSLGANTDSTVWKVMFYISEVNNGMVIGIVTEAQPVVENDHREISPLNATAFKAAANSFKVLPWRLMIWSALKSYHNTQI
ncbi:hypothetical protein FF38_02657 [Lucilia cuprina]|uniref:Uncharacterized protein n=1 Tax=Lucilia cuprina TaxID=7375 RepID=A0A0L0C4C6_LUCCU|nr:hypothetical protein FF38_02657 [Lucilia cuprina]